MGLFDRIESLFINRRQLYKKTEKMVENIKFSSDNCNVDSRIQYLIDNDIRVKYKVKDADLDNKEEKSILIRSSMPRSRDEEER